MEEDLFSEIDLGEDLDDEIEPQLDSLVGPNGKFKDIASLAKAKLESDKFIERLKAAQKTILISSHIFSTLNDTCDQIYVLRGGEIAQKVEKKDFQQLDEEMRQFVLGDKIESFHF